ncbi:imm11 family protein [Pseudosulfitobacter pseudonitzschiae]|uniref:imm11 family protein n=2 Tax=Pseudosulfitobacter pseudonitzschiae TaxID=1402135 RepID=UPI001AF7FAF8|nr:DUF1629 domain-containing protein [Pseudosulfitobacter pseudonitzschiae]MBM1814288.1 hypothetical protein [Pseudosulfitobacter pseudonitzschiae]MBM1831281.1 hypothetical protein [Pseudosulfitobacter pseudonitzschiae]MBM1836148.1 hypothetical protein [Pseudosulfitobacter pseudonitzschiae]MBM1840994.1 hypothetical protein [Pseudosulfitobacter pseudonitzschiae]MBM1845017.1 hypothetical protein [Pseudosulfitobacter pseudonitzschiae]
MERASVRSADDAAVRCSQTNFWLCLLRPKSNLSESRFDQSYSFNIKQRAEEIFMKCYILTRDFACPSSSSITWSLEPDGHNYSREEVGWHPYEDINYKNGRNTWNAAGPMTRESKEKLSKLWAMVRGGKKPHTGSHVLGDYITSPTESVIVSAKFVDVIGGLDEGLFDFTEHHKVWDAERNKAPWDGPFYFASVLPVLKSYDLDQSEIVKRTDVPEKYRGAYAPVGARRSVRASTIAGHLVWRDAYMRHVMCSEEFLSALKKLRVPEWKGYPVEVIHDWH